MRQKGKSQGTHNAMGILISVFVLVAAAQLVKVDLTTLIFGAAKEPPLPSQQTISPPSQPEAKPAQRAQTQTDGYEHYTDKNGNEVVVVPARYEASRAEPATMQSASEQGLQDGSPLLPEQVSPAPVAPQQSAPPRNIT